MSDNSFSQEPQDQDTLLDQLWIHQTVDLPDSHEMQRRWLTIRLKQRLYLCLDIAVVVAMLVSTYLSFDKFGTFAKSWVVLLAAGSVALTIYFAYLRRFALSWSTQSTDCHITQLRKQFENNIRIAELNRQLILWMVLAILIFIAGTGLFEDISPQKLRRQFLLSMLILAIIAPATWLWASRRARRFRQELQRLDKMFSQTSCDGYER